MFEPLLKRAGAFEGWFSPDFQLLQCQGERFLIRGDLAMEAAFQSTIGN
ncbi:hypothetical protein H6F86_23620 [Phormidium sp. FACHB-592]|uniref:Uncharacterized protein n=1 Tax=Stenomitos frigidus AS-A4 TaxID=2933935 RepID=A0ABV0KTL4_9CYAN|nr:hypothetical protein [Phormidium sp. FACHB-592]MBD2076822.1 hypothetical protein [Phormidium sp. FACHB-592]